MSQSKKWDFLYYELSRFIHDFIKTWNRHFAHPFNWKYDGKKLYGQAVRRLVTHILIENKHMELSFLSGQIELILNLKEVSMAYSDFKTLEQVHKKLGITIQDANGLYTHIEPVKLTNWFVETMEMAYPKAIRINTESARQALIVDNVFMELNRHIHISFFLHNTFNVDDSKGLTGNPDGIISQSRNQLYITCPVIVLVEAKKSDLGSGLGQCIAEMEGARIFNEREGNSISPVYGVVTDGVLWQFLTLQDAVVTIDSYLYSFEDGSKIVGILHSFILET